MRRSTVAPFALFLPLLSLVAASCADGPSESTNPVPPPPVAVDDFMDTYVSTLCERASRCYVVASHLDASCESGVRQAFGDDVKAAVDAGRILYNKDAAGVCIAGLAQMDCLAEQPSDATLEACLSALSGTIAAGDPCFGTFECKEGVCPVVTGDTCPAVCPAVAKDGEACSLLLGGPDCDAREGLRCSGGTCVSPSAKGGACIDNFACQSGLVCVANLCVPLRGDHEGCSQDASCKPGFFCVAEGDEGGICEPRVAVGGACAKNVEERNAAFRHVQCMDGLVCKGAGVELDGTNIAGACEEPVDEGGDCTVEPEGLQVFATGCKDGLVCDAGKCAKPPAAGAPCGKHFECLTGEAYCDPATITCKAPKANGEVCAIDKECGGRFCGGSGVCTELETFCGP